MKHNNGLKFMVLKVLMGRIAGLLAKLKMKWKLNRIGYLLGNKIKIIFR